MKPYSTYQYLNGSEMTERDKLEIGSRFWNEGKWDNFVAPFLPEDCSEMTFVDMGCNAGLFLMLSQDRGFKKIIGVDSDKDAVTRGLAWRDQNEGKYDIWLRKMENCIDDLPLADYTVLANAHYYFTINDWLDYLDKLQYKTRYCIIVTAEKRHGNRYWTLAEVEHIKRYFKDWEPSGFIDELPNDGDPSFRRLWGLCFKSKHLERIPAESLDCGNHVQDGFYGEIDNGTDYHDTRYYKILRPYRKRWGQSRLDRWMEEKIKVYESVKKNGLQKPILVGENNLILDGNHRYSMLQGLGNKTIFIRRT